MTDEVKIVAARQAQAKADKSDLLDRLKNKKRRTKELTVTVDGEPLTMKFEAISSRQLDDLRSKYPPTNGQRAEGFALNLPEFNPALVAATIVEPKMTVEDARELFRSEYWSAGELNQIVETASAVCLEGMNIPSNANA